MAAQERIFDTTTQLERTLILFRPLRICETLTEYIPLFVNCCEQHRQLRSYNLIETVLCSGNAKQSAIEHVSFYIYCDMTMTSWMEMFVRNPDGRHLMINSFVYNLILWWFSLELVMNVVMNGNLLTNPEETLMASLAFTTIKRVLCHGLTHDMPSGQLHLMGEVDYRYHLHKSVEFLSFATIASVANDPLVNVEIIEMTWRRYCSDTFDRHDVFDVFYEPPKFDVELKTHRKQRTASLNPKHRAEFKFGAMALSDAAITSLPPKQFQFGIASRAVPTPKPFQFSALSPSILVDLTPIEQPSAPNNILPPAPAVGDATTSNNPPPPAVEEDANACVICLSKQRTLAAIPCGHLCLCDECEKVLRCPICCIDVKWIKIFSP